MSIINTFDYDGEEIIKPGNNVRTIVDFPQTVLVVFSVKMRELFLNTYQPSKIGALYAAGWELPIWQFEYKGKKMGFFHTILGGAGAAALLENCLHWEQKNVCTLAYAVRWIKRLQRGICWFPQLHTGMRA